MQRLVNPRPGLERRDQQIEFAIAIQVVAHGVSTVLLHCDAPEISIHKKRFPGLVEEQTILLEAAVGLAGSVMFAGNLEEVCSPNRIILRSAGVDIMPPE